MPSPLTLPEIPAMGRSPVPRTRSSRRNPGGTSRRPIPDDGVRRLVSESWQRSQSFGLDPDAPPLLNVVDDDLRDYRDAHPLAQVLPVIHRLLVRHTIGSGLIVAIGDSSGRLLWVDGDRDLRRRAEGMAFIEGADWSERAVGTSAPGTALELGRSVQIKGPEHFNRTVHPWSCSAVPVRDRSTGELLGVIDITGREDAIAPVTLPLLEATVAAVEAELDLLGRQRSPRLLVHREVSTSGSAVRRAPRLPRDPARPIISPPPSLNILGLQEGLLKITDRSVTLSARHTEILTILAWHPAGLSAGELAHEVYGRDDAVVTLRAELVRLRRFLRSHAPVLSPASRPYRLEQQVELDAQRVLAFLDRGAHRVALSAYVGAVLPGSEAPGVQAIRDSVSMRLREALLADASVDALLTYARLPEARYDVEVWQTCMGLLPTRSPRRTAVVAHLELIERELA